MVSRTDVAGFRGILALIAGAEFWAIDWRSIAIGLLVGAAISFVQCVVFEMRDA